MEIKERIADLRQKVQQIKQKRQKLNRMQFFNPDSRKRDDEFSPHLAEPPGFY